MKCARDLPVHVIGWSPRADEPPELAPQFVNPVAVRLYTSAGVGAAVAWLRVEPAGVIAAAELPADLAAARLRCFCCTLRERDPRTHIERRRITSIDIRVEADPRATRAEGFAECARADRR